MKTPYFIGRKKELQELETLLDKKSSSLIVIQGRRRIGKSRLIQEFGKGKSFFLFSGLPPTPLTTAQSERDEFMKQLSRLTNLPEIMVDDWGKIFHLLAREVQSGPKVILFDEISWMGSKDPDFLGKLKNAWDLHFKNNPELILVLCGSLSSWIEKNILSSTGFLGRISLVMNLKELNLLECNEFLKHLGGKWSASEKFKILSVTGGVPRYLEELNSDFTADENIKRLCFKNSGILYREFDDIFSDLFSKRSPTYKKIVESLSDGPLFYNDICDHLGIEKSGYVNELLEDLIKAGFISRDYTWNLKSQVSSKLSHYRLSDNYIRFYLKYIEKNKSKIDQNYFDSVDLSSLSGWTSMMGFQFENLVLNNQDLILDKLKIKKYDVVNRGTFFQRKTTRTAGVQIDFLIQTKFNTLFVCEVKFSTKQLGKEIIEELDNKLKSLQTPKYFSAFPVLIYVSGITDSVLEESFLAGTVDFKDFLGN